MAELYFFPSLVSITPCSTPDLERQNRAWEITSLCWRKLKFQYEVSLIDPSILMKTIEANDRKLPRASISSKCRIGPEFYYLASQTE
jgi:hypothetical protein